MRKISNKQRMVKIQFYENKSWLLSSHAEAVKARTLLRKLYEKLLVQSNHERFSQVFGSWLKTAHISTAGMRIKQ